MLIRKGQPEDMPAVLNLIKELAVFENEPDAVIITADDLVKDGFGATSLFETFVAEKDGLIIGVALFYYRYSTWKGKTIHLEDLIVNEGYRGIGAGAALYKAVINYAKNKGLRRVEWAVLDWNTHAVDFYKRSGATVFDDWRTVQMDEAGIANFVDKL